MAAIRVYIGLTALALMFPAMADESSATRSVSSRVVIAYERGGSAVLVVDGKVVGYAKNFAIDPKYVPDPKPKPRDPMDPKNFPEPKSPPPPPICTMPCIDFSVGDGDITHFGPDGRDFSVIRVRSGTIEAIRSGGATLDR